ncbi:MAG TPA: hypothetical protein VLK82_14335 [Candidatus Tectomicrobia bacterium]|nr:hypothetical protein [Candidatus Tectomicrobia bacterium]
MNTEINPKPETATRGPEAHRKPNSQMGMKWASSFHHRMLDVYAIGPLAYIVQYDPPKSIAPKADWQA